MKATYFRDLVFVPRENNVWVYSPDEKDETYFPYPDTVEAITVEKDVLTVETMYGSYVILGGPTLVSLYTVLLSDARGQEATA